MAVDRLLRFKFTFAKAILQMTAILVDLADEEHDLQINWWNWRPILAILRQSALIDEEQFERMGANGCGGQLSAAEAIQVAEFLKRQILPQMKDNEQMHVDGQVSTVSDVARPICSIDAYDLYAARKSCVESFITFCERSKGFIVY